MNNLIKRTVAILCVVITLFSAVGFSAVAAYENDLPVVYLRGSTEIVYDKNGKQVWPLTIGFEDILLKHRNELIGAFSLTVMTGDWSVYGNALSKVFDIYFAPGVLDNNGNSKNGADINHSAAPKKKTSNFLLGDYVFKYDPRIDPWEIADQLNEYINNVLKATGKKKVQLVARCMGSCMASAYITKYGSDKVDTCIYYASAAKGSTLNGELFSGRLKFDEEVLNNYANTYMGESDDEISQFLAGVVNITYSLSLLGAGTDIASDFFQKLSIEIFPQLLRQTYGNMPAYWAMVSEEYYEEAKNFVFGGYENEYAELIRKIDNYHYNVLEPLESNLKSFNARGMKVVVLAKYNRPFAPYLESSELQGDARISLEDISFGAVGPNIGEHFSVDYLNEARFSGTLDYISDDLAVDASTCLFPEYTWFFKDINHGTFPACINDMIMEILHIKSQVTVDDFAQYPRYMQFSYDTWELSPVTDAPPSGDSGTVNPLLKIISMLKSFIAIIRGIFSIIS